MLEQQRDYVMRTVEERGVQLVRLWFTDVLGNLKSFAISHAELENALEDGHTFDGSSIDGFSRIQEADVLAFPDPNTFEVLPWGEPREARVFCDIRNLDGTSFDADPRHVLRRNLDKARAQGYDLLVAPDIEFFYFDPPEKGRTPNPLDEAGFFDLTTTDVAGSLRKETIDTLEKLSIVVGSSFHEDAPSQHEIDLRHTDALGMADSIMTFRLVVKEVAAKQGVHATFMPKPLEGVQGSGMHLHLSLFEGGEIWMADFGAAVTRLTALTGVAPQQSDEGQANFVMGDFRLTLQTAAIGRPYFIACGETLNDVVADPTKLFSLSSNTKTKLLGLVEGQQKSLANKAKSLGFNPVAQPGQDNETETKTAKNIFRAKSKILVPSAWT